MDDAEFVHHENMTQFYKKFDQVADNFLKNTIRLMGLCNAMIHQYDSLMKEFQKIVHRCLSNVDLLLEQQNQHFLESNVTQVC